MAKKSKQKVMVYDWPVRELSGAKRANIQKAETLGDWFFGQGKSEETAFEGSWWDMICFARNVLASENTKIAAPEFYKPELAVDQYLGNEPYTYVDNHRLAADPGGEWDGDNPDDDE